MSPLTAQSSTGSTPSGARSSSVKPSVAPSSTGFSSPPTLQEALKTFREKHPDYRSTLDDTARYKMTAEDFRAASQGGSIVVGVTFDPKHYGHNGYKLCRSKEINIIDYSLWDVTVALGDHPDERIKGEAKRYFATAVVNAANASFGVSSGGGGQSYQFVMMNPNEFNKAVSEGADLCNVFGTEKKKQRYNSSTYANYD